MMRWPAARPDFIELTRYGQESDMPFKGGAWSILRHTRRKGGLRTATRAELRPADHSDTAAYGAGRAQPYLLIRFSDQGARQRNGLGLSVVHGMVLSYDGA